MILTTDSILELFKKHPLSERCKELLNDRNETHFKTTVSPIDGLIMRALILEHSKGDVLEFGSYRGFSTCFLADAAEILNKKVITFEINKTVINSFLLKNLAKYNINNVEVVNGNALQNIPKAINERNLDVDFIFIDSDHSKATAKKYCKELFPIFNKDAIICIHDISAKVPSKYGELDTNTKGHIRGEHEAVQDWVKNKQPEYTLTHAVLGGQFEKSKNIPINEEFYKEASKIYNIDLKKYIRSAPVIMITKNAS